MAGIQVDLSPLASRAVFGVLARELVRQTFLACRDPAAAPRPEVTRAWALLCQNDGWRAGSRAGARETAYSRRHLSAKFADEFGLTPQRAGRVLRFGPLRGHARVSSGASTPTAASRSLRSPSSVGRANTGARGPRPRY